MVKFNKTRTKNPTQPGNSPDCLPFTASQGSVVRIEVGWVGEITTYAALKPTVVLPRVTDWEGGS